MPGKRPHFYTTIAELEKLVEEKRHDPATLRGVLAELDHRDTDRAGRLRAKINAILDGLELNLAPAPTNQSAPDEPVLPAFIATPSSGQPNIVPPSPNRTELRAMLRQARLQNAAETPADEPEALAVRDGVVVQGPPGTGKTHTIANIISHYLATGRRVLVTSQKSPALQVLREQLPPAIRPLAVSLLDSDREGLRQFRASVDLIAERLQSLRRSDLQSEISGLESRIDGLHQTLAKIDREIDRLGRTALEPVKIDGQSVPPLEAALEVLQAGDDALWIDDEITPAPSHAPTFTNEDIAAVRQARAAIGTSIAYLGKQLPPADLLADVEGILAAHTDLAGAAAINREISGGTTWSLVNQEPETIEAVAGLSERLSAWSFRRDELGRSAPSWDHAIETLLSATDDPLLTAIRALADDARALADDHAWFLTRPVELPDDALEDARRTTEMEVQAAILKLMEDGKVWTNAALKDALPTILPLTSVDRQRSPTRPNEEKWEEQVNNALTRNGRSNSLYARGVVTRVGFGQHRLITEKPSDPNEDEKIEIK